MTGRRDASCQIEPKFPHLRFLRFSPFLCLRCAPLEVSGSTRAARCSGRSAITARALEGAITPDGVYRAALFRGASVYDFDRCACAARDCRHQCARSPDIAKKCRNGSVTPISPPRGAPGFFTCPAMKRPLGRLTTRHSGQKTWQDSPPCSFQAKFSKLETAFVSGRSNIDLHSAHHIMP
jgi:hypothetical protein